jgi:hypothetical protein
MQLEVLDAMDGTSDVADSKHLFLSREAYTEKSSQISPEAPEITERQLCAAPDLADDYYANNNNGEFSV